MQCASNIRQLCTALINYSTENRGRFPSNHSMTGQTRFWYDLARIGRFMPKSTVSDATLDTSSLQGPFMFCPSYEQIRPNLRRNYAMNIWASSEVNEACDTRFEWDGTDDRGRTVPAGVYLARFKADGGYEAFKKILFRGR